MLSGINIVINDAIPSNTIIISPDLQKYFLAAINNQPDEVDKHMTDLMNKAGIITNLLNKKDSHDSPK